MVAGKVDPVEADTADQAAAAAPVVAVVQVLGLQEPAAQEQEPDSRCDHNIAEVLVAQAAGVQLVAAAVEQEPVALAGSVREAREREELHLAHHTHSHHGYTERLVAQGQELPRQELPR